MDSAHVPCFFSGMMRLAKRIIQWGAGPHISDPCTLGRARAGGFYLQAVNKGTGPPRPGLSLVKVTYLRRLKLRSSLFAKCP